MEYNYGGDLNNNNAWNNLVRNFANLFNNWQLLELLCGGREGKIMSN